MFCPPLDRFNYKWLSYNSKKIFFFERFIVIFTICRAYDQVLKWKFMKIYAITPSFSVGVLDKINSYFGEGNSFLQLRDKGVGKKETLDFITAVLKIAGRYKREDLCIVLNSYNNFNIDGEDLRQFFVLDGIHQSFNNENHKNSSRKFEAGFNLISCHSEKQLKLAADYGYDAVTLSPLFYTMSHPERKNPLGFDRFKQMCEKSLLPVFALGGIKKNDEQKFAGIKNCSGIGMIRGVFG